MDPTRDDHMAADQRWRPAPPGPGGSRGPNGRVAEADLRASDADRDLAATELGEHFQAGRLDQAEFDERLTAALRARTRGDLAGLLADLPVREQPPALPAEPAGSYRMLPLLIPLMFAAVIAVGYTAGSGPHHEAGGGPWPLLWLWWLIPLVVFRMRHGRGHQDPAR